MRIEIGENRMDTGLSRSFPGLGMVFTGGFARIPPEPERRLQGVGQMEHPLQEFAALGAS